MDGRSGADAARDLFLIKSLTYLMFTMFAMTTDAVGSIIPTLLTEFHLSNTAASAFHYVPMAAIALGAITLGFLADKIGRKRTIVVGLILYGVSSVLFAFGSVFSYFVALLAAAGIGISVFKTGALALIGDITKSTTDHSSFMNTLEGFFGIGAIIGPAIVATLLSANLSWRWLYVIAAGVCALLIVLALSIRYPETRKAIAEDRRDFSHTLRVLRDPFALAFSTMVMLYVAVESAVYVWMPTFLEAYRGGLAWLPLYALTIFFILRAFGRFLGAWLIGRFAWTWILALFGVAIALCVLGSLVGGADVGIYLLPLSGLFMSVIYPTLNSKGISCFRKSEHGAAAGVILFFTAVAAALGPLAMGAVSDSFGNIRYGFMLAAGFALLLAAGLLVNLVFDPARKRLESLEELDYARQTP
jgi:DHA1 family quinolone resistance protein-like MFS transporter